MYSVEGELDIYITEIEVQSRRPLPLAFCPFPAAYVPKAMYHRVRKDFGGLLRRTANVVRKRVFTTWCLTMSTLGPAEIISKTPLLNFTPEFERVCISEAVPSMREWSITTYTGGYTYP